MDKREAREHVRRERTELLALLEGLTPEDWEAPSLCTGWRVRDVVAHVVAYDRFAPSLARDFVRSRFDVDRVNLRTAAAWSSRSTDELLARLQANVLPGGVTRLIGWRVALQDGVIHQQDVRRPLGRPRAIPADRVVGVIECLVDPPTLTGLQSRAAGLRVEATDIEWVWGDGQLVSGAAEALVMALAGRESVVGELTGPGVSLLRQR
jgi:uncharacterized protein (TIGR03083 family)